jgi:hypothetical protein
MATQKQKKALDKIIENNGNVSKAMREAGYPATTARNPQQLTRSKGFIELCEERGLTDDFLVEALVEDIGKKKGNRKAELELGFKVKGRTNPEEVKSGGNLTVNVLNYYESDNPPQV